MYVAANYVAIKIRQQKTREGILYRREKHEERRKIRGALKFEERI